MCLFSLQYCNYILSSQLERCRLSITFFHVNRKEHHSKEVCGILDVWTVKTRYASQCQHSQQRFKTCGITRPEHRFLWLSKGFSSLPKLLTLRRQPGKCLIWYSSLVRLSDLFTINAKQNISGLVMIPVSYTHLDVYKRQDHSGN